MKENLLLKTNDIDFALIREKIKNGALIIYPTDTVYGIAANINDLNAIKKIYEAKERNFNSPLIALLSDYEYISDLAIIDEYNMDKVKKLCENFWPGALTIILKKKEIVPDIMVSGGDTIGVRIPNLKIARDIIRVCGGILPTTSANISGEASPVSFDMLSSKIKARADILVDDGNCKLGEVSTIIDMTQKVPKILRLGAISKKEIIDLIGEIL